VRPVVLYGSERIKVPYAGAFLPARPTLKELSCDKPTDGLKDVPVDPCCL